ncbi:MAG: hypothetical protein Q8O89_01645 [Nanoarchaeota archaeon]|nr:hypothetical protein [Nanoarchaeota archaeon]
MPNKTKKLEKSAAYEASVTAEPATEDKTEIIKTTEITKTSETAEQKSLLSLEAAVQSGAMPNLFYDAGGTAVVATNTDNIDQETLKEYFSGILGELQVRERLSDVLV